MMPSRRRKWNLPSTEELLPPLHGCGSLHTETENPSFFLQTSQLHFLKSDYELGSLPAGASDKEVSSQRRGHFCTTRQQRQQQKKQLQREVLTELLTPSSSQLRNPNRNWRPCGQASPFAGATVSSVSPSLLRVDSHSLQ